MEHPPYVAVVGSGRAGTDALDVAEAIGRDLAEAGATLVCGGLGGVMEAACRGASAVGGTTVGLLPGTDRSSANRYVTVAIPTGLGELRNGLIVRSSDAVIAVGGEYGTLSEVALALKTRVPVIGVDTWRLDRDGQDDDGIHRVDGPREAAAAALAAIPG